jgi:hypothetical protein
MVDRTLALRSPFYAPMIESAVQETDDLHIFKAGLFLLPLNDICNMSEVGILSHNGLCCDQTCD